MQLGMTWEQYWFGDVRMTASFIEAHRLKRREENERLWLQGMYFFDGMSRIMNNVFAEKGSQHQDYPDKPYPLFEGEKTPEELEDQEEAEEMRARAYMLQMDMALGRGG